jgi:hypothetical protein
MLACSLTGPTGATCGSTRAGPPVMPTLSPLRGGIGLTRAGRHPGLWRHERGGVASGEPHRTDRVHANARSGRRRLRRQLGAAHRKRHRFYQYGIWHEREIPGATQRDRTAHRASGSPSGSNHTPGDRPVRRYPSRGAFARGGAAPDRRARRARDRAGGQGIRALREWRPDRHRERVDGASSRSDNCPQSIGSASSSRAAASSRTGPIRSTHTGARPATSTASSRARSLPTFPCRRRPSTNW